MEAIVGMDFGTTNSGMAVYDGRLVRLLPLDPVNANPGVIRSALYVANDQTVAIGREAVNRYFEQNTGRPAKLQQVWVGEIEIRGADMHYVRDVYVWVDILSPGRLFLSFKTSLRDLDYQGTVIGQFFYALEDLVAIYLSLARIRAEQALGRAVRQVVLGRPVHFSDDPQQDAVAQQRLLNAAFRAGYEKVYLEYEPTAAAHHYAATMEWAENVLIFDFGGGTLDITIMRLDGRGGREVLATGGIPIAGDIFDQKVVRAKLPKHFGEGTLYGLRGRELPIPRWIYDVFSNWQTIMELQTPSSRKTLNEIAQTARAHQQLEALITLVSGNYSLHMFDAVERAKRELSERIGTMIRFDLPGNHIFELITRAEFDNIIRSEAEAIERRLDETLQASGLAASHIDSVIRTGGSSQIPLFDLMLQRKFGPQKVRSIDVFSSVTAGLGIIAHGLGAGEMEARAYTAADAPPVVTSSKRPDVTPVNLALIQRRMAARETSEQREEGERPLVVVRLTSGNRVEVVADQEGPGSRGAEAQEGNDVMVLATEDEPLLLVTSRYRFMLVTPRQIMELKELGLGVAEFYHFGREEVACTLNQWTPIREQSKLVVITTKGFVRAYPAEALTPSIEGPVPFLFDQPLPGVPTAVLGSNDGDHLVIVTDQGRAVRVALDAMPSPGLQALNRQPDERIIAALSARPEADFLLATAQGYARRQPVGDVPLLERPNMRGRVMIMRRPVRAAVPLVDGQELWTVASGRIVPTTLDRVPRDDEGSTRSYDWLKLEPGETLDAVLIHDRGAEGAESNVSSRGRAAA